MRESIILNQLLKIGLISSKNLPLGKVLLLDNLQSDINKEQSKDKVELKIFLKKKKKSKEIHSKENHLQNQNQDMLSNELIERKVHEFQQKIFSIKKEDSKSIFFKNLY